MPNFDSGTYFLTALVPVYNRRLVANEESISSPVHVLRQRLEALPTALQTRVTQAKGANSPFSRNTRNHFVRLVVIDNPAFNGREQPTTLSTTIFVRNPAVAKPVDQLKCPYLLLVAEFDAASGEDAELEDYLALLWQTMEPELRQLFEFCWNFGAVDSAAAFAAYIRRCQIETTMPFHDYWEGRPQLGGYPLAGWKLAIPVVAALAVTAFLVKRAPLPLLAVALAIAAALAAYGTLWWVKRLSLRPFPAPPDATLPDVLKALHLQRAFAAFAIEQQGADAAQLHAAFAAFVAAQRPEDRAGPTQPAGAIPA